MPTASFSRQIEENSLELIWSLWAELGVSAWTRRHSDTLIDIEPLILFTAALADADPRLRDESTDWCLTYGRYVSKVRLRNLLTWYPRSAQRSFGEYAATINRHSGLRWPDLGAKPRPRFERSRRSRLESFDRPALLSLRLRAIFGVSARAEILRILLAAPGIELTTSELADEAGYGKRSVAEALESLWLAGLVTRIPFRNASRYVLRHEVDLRSVIRDVPAKFIVWPCLFALLFALIEFARKAEDTKPLSRLVETQRLIEEQRSNIVRSGVVVPPKLAPTPEAWSGFADWVTSLTGSLARNTFSGARVAAAAGAVH